MTPAKSNDYPETCTGVPGARRGAAIGIVANEVIAPRFSELIKGQTTLTGISALPEPPILK
eukprot:3355878-Prorocentrum_lima.AAC.1